MKTALKIMAILILAAAGGMVSQIFLIPYLMNIPFFGESAIFENLKREIIVNPTQEIIIKESEALAEAAGSVEAAVFHLSSSQGQGCGFSLTSDGQVLTRASLLPQESAILVDGRETNFRVLKKDLELGLALIKIERGNLKTTAFADLNKLKIGASVFLIASQSSESINLAGGIKKVVNQGIVKTFSENSIATNILEKEDFSDCPIFTFEGKFLGLSRISQEGEVSALPVSKIRSFVGL